MLRLLSPQLLRGLTTLAIITVVVLTLQLLSTQPAHAEPTDKPNFVIIMADDKYGQAG